MISTDSLERIFWHNVVILGPEEKEPGYRRHKTHCKFYTESAEKECQIWKGHCSGSAHCHEYEEKQFKSQKYDTERTLQEERHYYLGTQVYEALREWQEEQNYYFGF